MARLASLTAREREVIALSDEGRKNQQLAARLSCSETTVQPHPTAMGAKPAGSGRLESVMPTGTASSGDQ